MNGFAEFTIYGSDRRIFIRPDSVEWFGEDNDYVVISLDDRTVHVRESLDVVCNALEEAERGFASSWLVESEDD